MRPHRMDGVSLSFGLLFLRNSVTGALEAHPRKGTGGTLNDALHANA